MSRDDACRGHISESHPPPPTHWSSAPMLANRPSQRPTLSLTNWGNDTHLLREPQERNRSGIRARRRRGERGEKMAEGVGFEPTRRSSRLSDFESGAFSRSAIPPQTTRTSAMVIPSSLHDSPPAFNCFVNVLRMFCKCLAKPARRRHHWKQHRLVFQILYYLQLL